MKVEATFGIRLIASILILIPALCGLLLQTLLGIALYTGWKTFRENSIYLITVQLMCCDVCALMLDLYAAFPLTLTGVQYMGDSIALYYVPLAFEGIAFNGIFHLSFLLTVNRFLLFLFPKLHEMIFTRRGTKILSLLVWTYVFALIVGSNIAGCRKRFSKEGFYFWFDCGENPIANGFKNFIHVNSCVVPCVMALMYIAIYFKLKCAGKGLHARHSQTREINYLMQTVLICALILLEAAGFLFLPFIGLQGYGQFFLNILLNSILISNNLVTPIVILHFNSEVRDCLRRRFARENRVSFTCVTQVPIINH